MEGLIKIRIPLATSDWHDFASETLWAAPIGNSQYVLHNAPFFADDLSYGDTIYAEVEDDDFPVFKFVTVRGGNSTYRIVLDAQSTKEDFEKYIKPINELKCSTEGMHERQFALDVPAETNIYEVFDLLTKGEEDGIWFFSSAHIGHNSEE